MSRYISHIVLMLSLVTAVACSNKVTEVVDEVELPKIKDDELIAALDSLANVSYHSFYTKISTSYKDSAQDVSFKTSIRIVSDSCTNASITYATIPVVGVLITPDSVKITNKRDKCAIVESLDFFREQFGVAFELKDIENLLMGIPVGYDPEAKYQTLHKQIGGYTIHSHKQREIKKIEKKGFDEIIFSYMLSPDLKSLKSTNIYSPKDSAEVYINYKTRELVEDQLLPAEISMIITTPRQQIVVEMDYKKTRINESEEIYFVIPESYERCE